MRVCIYWKHSKMNLKKIDDLPKRRRKISRICKEYNDKIEASNWKKAYYIERAKIKIIETLLWDESVKIQWLDIGWMTAKQEIEKIKCFINSFESLDSIERRCNNRINTSLKETNQLEIQEFDSYSLMKSKSNSVQKGWETILNENQVLINDRIKDNLTKLKAELTTIFNGNQWKVWTEDQKESNLLNVKKTVIDKLISDERKKIRELDFCRMAVKKELDEIEYEIYNCKDISQIRDYCNNKIDQLIKYLNHPETKTTDFEATSILDGRWQLSMGFPIESEGIDWEIFNELKEFIKTSPKQQKYEFNNNSFIWRSANIKIPTHQGNGEIFTADLFVLSEVDVDPSDKWKWKVKEWQITRVEADKQRKYMPSVKNICNLLRAIKCYIKDKHWITIDDGIDYEKDLRWWLKCIAWEYLKKLLWLNGIYFINGEDGEKRKIIECFDNNFYFRTFTWRMVIPIDEIKHLAIFLISKNEQ